MVVFCNMIGRMMVEESVNYGSLLQYDCLNYGIGIGELW